MRGKLRKLEDLLVGLFFLAVDGGLLYTFYWLLTLNPLSTIITAIILICYGVIIVMVILALGYLGLVAIYSACRD